MSNSIKSVVIDSFIPLLPANDKITKTGPTELTVVLEGAQMICLIGQCKMQVLEGCVEVLGYKATAGPKEYFICSPKCFALLSVSNYASKSVIILRSHIDGIPDIQNVQVVFQGIMSHSSEQIEDIPGLWIVRKPIKDIQILEYGSRWAEVGGAIAPLQGQVVFVCGNRKVGKSTFCRFLVNRLLNYHKTVGLMEFDIGQSEFTPPGFVSFNTVSEPIFSPPFCHASKSTPSRSKYLGLMSLSEGPLQYVYACIDLFNECKKNNQFPVVINMLGWTSGLGFTCLSHLFHAIKPTHILAFGDQKVDDFVSRALFSKSNFPGDSPYAQNEQVAIAYFSPISSLNVPRLSPADIRTLMYWSYFHYNRSVQRYEFNVPICEHRPFVISKQSIHIHFTFPIGQQSFWPILNCALACLGHSPVAQPGAISNQESALPIEYFAMAFIRGVDPIKKIIYILTPFPLDQIQNCNIIVVGRQTLPVGLMVSGSRYDGPYFSYQSALETSGFRPRKVRHNIQRASNIGNK